MSEIRIATLNDLDRLARLDEQCFSDSWSREVYHSLLESPACTALLIEESAFAIWSIAVSGPYGSESELLRLGVRPRQRRQGLGRALIEWHLAGLGDERSKVFLEVRSSNQAAIRLYRSLSFVEIGRRAAYYGDGEDALLMRYCRAGEIVDHRG
jgi:ribosomal-protein-alanine N-acetyltransferase